MRERRGLSSWAECHAQDRDQGGLDLARALHEITPRQPLLLVTASTIDANVDRLAKGGISEVLRRPLASTDLATALARSLSSSGTLQP